DPLAIRRPCNPCLPLVADCELCREAALRRNDPDVVSPAHVRDERNALAVRRPRRMPDLTCHIQLLDGQASWLDLRVGLGRDLFGIGNGLWSSQCLSRAQGSETCKGEEKKNAGAHDGCLSYDRVESRASQSSTRTKSPGPGPGGTDDNCP